MTEKSPEIHMREAKKYKWKYNRHEKGEKNNRINCRQIIYDTRDSDHANAPGGECRRLMLSGAN